MHPSELPAAIVRARNFYRRSGIDPYSEDSYEGLAYAFAELAVQLADKCVVGLPCKRHGGAVAEELRRGIEKILADDLDDHPFALRELLDETDARDSLAFLEASHKS
jgi:hypothetical protein